MPVSLKAAESLVFGGIVWRELVCYRCEIYIGGAGRLSAIILRLIPIHFSKGIDCVSLFLFQ